MSEQSLQLMPLKAVNLPANNDGKRLKVTGKLRTVLHAMIWDGLPMDQAASAAGMTTYAVRKAMGRSHVLQYMRSEREVLRQSVCTRNISRLAEIRDAADNMPAVNAIRLLEDIGSDAPLSAQQQRAPGVVIVINGAPASPVLPATIEHTDK